MRLDELNFGDSFTGFYILKNVFLKVTNSGKPYLSCSLADASMMIEAKVWDYAGPIGPAEEGKIAKVQGVMQEFKGAPQIKVERIRIATENDPYDLADLVPVAPIDRDAAYIRLETLVESFEDADYKAVCQALLERHGEKLKKMPAAKSVHHSFVGGLLMHTVYMMETAAFLADLYGGIIDRSLLLSGTLLHDLAKIHEFVVSDIGMVTEYSVKGQLLGHLVMGAQETAEICRGLGTPEEKAVLLQHMLLSHHGQPEFGAAVVPMCAEAEMLNYIDNIDAKMEIYRENLEKTQPGTFSPRIFALEKKIYNHG
ncbi:MAG: TraI domain-containing protein [Oscillospiraceae bacterium]|nr:TraI domain-containing protein [Oscillospiraceae bacterium]